MNTSIKTTLLNMVSLCFLSGLVSATEAPKECLWVNLETLMTAKDTGYLDVDGSRWRVEWLKNDTPWKWPFTDVS